MKHINFIPFDLRPKQEIPGLLIPAGVALILVVNVTGAYLWNITSAHHAQSELTQLENENLAITQKINVLGGSQNRLKLDEALAKMKVVLAKKNYWSGLFKEMSAIIPEGIWLTTFSDVKERASSNNQVVVKPKTTTQDGETLLIRGETTTPSAVAQFLTTLEKSHHFAGVQIRFTEREENIQPVRYQFEFSVPIKTLGSEGG